MALEQMTTHIYLEMSGETKRYVVSAKQGDKATRFVAAHLLNDGVEYSIPTDAKAIINIRKPDGKFCYNSCTFAGSIVTVELTNQALAAAGTAYCDIEIRTADSTQMITSASFTIEIEETQRNIAATESSSEFTALDKALKDNADLYDRTLAAASEALEFKETIETTFKDEMDAMTAAADRVEDSVTRIEELSENEIQQTVIGTMLTINDAAEAALRQFIMEGESVQNGTPSIETPITINGVNGVLVSATTENILPNRGKTETNNGITYTHNTDGSIKAVGTSTGISYTNLVGDINTDYKTKKFVLKKGVTYYNTTGIDICYRTTGGTYGAIQSSITPSSNYEIGALYIQCASAAGVVRNNLFYPQLTIGQSKAEYVQCKENTLLLTLDESLKSLGEYKDRIETRNGKLGVLRYVKKLIMDEKQQYMKNDLNAPTSKLYYVPFTENNGRTMSDKLPEKIGNLLADEEFIASSPTGNVIYLNIGKHITENTVAAVKEYLTKNPITAYYLLKEPEFTELPEEIQDQWKKLKTYNELTYVMNDIDREIKCVYVVDTKGYFDRNMSERDEAILELQDEVSEQKETIESFGLFVDESGYLCQQLEGEE